MEVSLPLGYNMIWQQFDQSQYRGDIQQPLQQGAKSSALLLVVVVVVVAFSLLVRILGECSTIYSPPALPLPTPGKQKKKKINSSIQSLNTGLHDILCKARRIELSEGIVSEFPTVMQQCIKNYFNSDNNK